MQSISANQYIVWYTTESGITRPYNSKGNCHHSRAKALEFSLLLSLKGYNVWLDQLPSN